MTRTSPLYKLLNVGTEVWEVHEPISDLWNMREQLLAEWLGLDEEETK